MNEYADEWDRGDVNSGTYGSRNTDHKSGAVQRCQSELPAGKRFIRRKRAPHTNDAPKGLQQISPGQRPEKRDLKRPQAL